MESPIEPEIRMQNRTAIALSYGIVADCVSLQRVGVATKPFIQGDSQKGVKNQEKLNFSLQFTFSTETILLEQNQFS